VPKKAHIAPIEIATEFVAPLLNAQSQPMKKSKIW
jgi:hypothetical protein